MSRRRLAAFLWALLAAPSFGAPVELVRVEGAPAVASPAPAAVVSALPAAPALSAALAPAPALAAPVAAPAAAPAPAAFAAAPSAVPAALPSARSAEGVSARVDAAKRAWAAPVERILSDHDVLLLGENHGSLESVGMLTREMPRLTAAGVRTVGIEGLKRPHQAEVDAYLSGRADEVSDAALGFSPRRREAFRALLSAARGSGVRVVALGLPLDRWAGQTAALAAERTGRPVGDFAGTAAELFDRAQGEYEEGFNEAVAEVFLTRRNRSMAEFLLDAMKGGGKAVVLVGQAHVDGLDMVPGRLLRAPGDWGTLSTELAALAVRAFSLTQTGGLFLDVDSAQLDRQARPRSYAAAAKASPQGAPVYVPLGPDRGLWHAGGRVPSFTAH